MATLVQWAAAETNNTTATTTVTLGATPTVGNLLVSLIVVRSATSPLSWTPPTGFTLLDGEQVGGGFSNGGAGALAYKAVAASPPTSYSWVTNVNYKRAIVAEFSGVTVSPSSTTTVGGPASAQPVGPLSTSASSLLIGANWHGDPDNGPLYTEEAGWTTIETHRLNGFDPAFVLSYRVTTTGGSYSHTPSQSSGSGYYAGILAAFEDASPPAVPPIEIPYVAPEPGGALVEIKAAEVGAYRWGTAVWGDPSVWSTAGWRNVTPESVDVEILWGSQRPELGILSKVEPASWAITFYDPDRALDPANREGPYYGDLEPGLPVRVSHGGVVIKQGVAESIGYEFSREAGAESTAYMRVTDLVSVLANAQVPSDVTLSDTLYARARDAIAAAGLAVTVLGDPPGGDPVLAPWVTGQERSAWEWIVDAAESVLWMPIVTNHNMLGFRPYAEPLDRARRLASPNLVGLQSIVAHNGLYSVVTALQSPGDGGAVITRELTPKPRYGARQYDRDEVTPNAGDWAMAVLSDRSTAGLRWVPGEVYPLTAADVTYFAQIEGMERVGVYYPEASPAVVQDVIIVGGRIAVTAKRDSEAIWSFEYQAAQAAPTPLVDDLDATTLLARDDDPSALLYPDG